MCVCVFSILYVNIYSPVWNYSSDWKPGNFPLLQDDYMQIRLKVEDQKNSFVHQTRMVRNICSQRYLETRLDI